MGMKSKGYFFSKCKPSSLGTTKSSKDTWELEHSTAMNDGDGQLTNTEQLNPVWAVRETKTGLSLP